MEVDKEDDKNQDGDEFGRANISKFFRTLLTKICNDMNPRGQNNRATLDSIKKLYFKKFPGRKAVLNGLILLTEREFLRMLWKDAAMKKHLREELKMKNDRGSEFESYKGFQECVYQRQTTVMTADIMKEQLEKPYKEQSENKSEISENQFELSES
ncbi:hypothetical protein BGX27_005007 [Mortierella sp. AM989]|nr:hypothetical protein BGX27_005007 [Mortierella sp. AM989]